MLHRLLARRRSHNYLGFSLAATSLITTAGNVAADEFEFKDEENIVLLGDAFIEQEQYGGWIEFALTTANADRRLHFRNIGWSGDTPAGASRFGLSLLQAGNEPDDEGWSQLQRQIADLKPSVLLLGYGMASSIEGGEQGVEKFIADYERLIATALSVNPACRFIFLSPVARTDDTTGNTAQLYAAAIKRVAESHNAPYIDLAQITSDEKLHQDPIHLNDAGYQAVAKHVVGQLGQTSAQTGANERLRQVILRKNEWFFHRSRPANMAYVFGFRKHEQGQNAVEIPQFDPLIKKEEDLIAALLSNPAASVPEVPAVTESKYAKFTPQPLPEFTVAEDLQVELWAENPQLNKPIHMNFDSRGRLWVASSEAYPMIEVGQSAPDKIIVLEDTDRDGKADQSLVFADGLLIPTGILPGDDGVYVAQSTDLLHLSDTDGDGTADRKTRVLSGFGTEDTHHNLHTLLWGPDGRMYMNQSVYTRTDAETPSEIVRLKAGGGFRLNPQTLRMEIVFRGLWNPWGNQFDRFGNTFLTDGAGFNGIAYSFPGAAFNPTPHARRQLELISPGNYPKFASEEIVYSDALPPEWQGSIVTCDFRANRVTRFSLAEQDAGFVTKQEDDLLRTSVPSFRPIDVKIGPDGALYIADWSNPIINHGEVDFRDERRDRWHGRIWRVTWKKAPVQSLPKLEEMSSEQLLAELSSENRYRRDQARKLLSNDLKHYAAIDRWSKSVDSEMLLLEALWLQQAIGHADLGLLDRALQANDANVRAAAVRVLRGWSGVHAEVDQVMSVEAALSRLEKVIGDKHPRVRLEAIVACEDLHDGKAVRIALQALQHPVDRFIDYALWRIVNETYDVTSELYPTFATSDDAQQTAALEFVLSALEPHQAAGILADYLTKNDLDTAGKGPWIELIGKAGSEEQVRGLLDRVLENKLVGAAAARAIEAIGNAVRFRKVSITEPSRVVQLLKKSDKDAQLASVRLVGALKLNEASDVLGSLANDAAADQSLQTAAIAALGEMKSSSATELLGMLIKNSHDAKIRRAALVSLVNSDFNQAIPYFWQLLATVDNDEAARDLWRVMLNQKDAGTLLAKSLPAGGLSKIAANAGVRIGREGRDEPELIDALKTFADSSMLETKLTSEQLATLMQKVTAEGDPHAGELIYRRADLACATCHAIGGVGGKVGPDMTSLGASAPLDYLIESLFDPNAKIKEGFHSTVVMTEEGQVYTGIETGSTENEVVLRTANNELVRIPRDEIEGQKNGVSLMPTGVIERLPDVERVNLISFLSKLGKPGDFDASRSGVGRVYQVLAGTHIREQAGTQGVIDGTDVEGWQRFTSLVSGDVTKTLIMDLTKQPIHVGLVNIYLRTRFSASQASEVQFLVEGLGSGNAWIDGQEATAKVVNGNLAVQGKVTSGEHTLLLRFDARELPNAFRIKSSDVNFSVE